MQYSHPFAGSSFNRLAERRDDDQWLNQLDANQIQLIPIWRGRVLVDMVNDVPRMASLDRHQLVDNAQQPLILLGEISETIFFAVNIDSESEPLVHNTARFHDLRAVSGLLDRDQLGLLGYARALIHWRNTHQFCGKCGSPNHSVRAGHLMECSNQHCRQQCFPRIDPAVIVLITDRERIMLGRQAHFPPGRYSTIAGFVEWAESIEEAVVREVREETGIIVDNVQYHSSQPWPFPSSLMLGFIAQAVTTEVALLDKELEDARWFTRADIAEGALHLPPTQSISFRLIESWYNGAATRLLRDEPGALIDKPAHLFKS
jgi:NAD+ diphosphatase